MKILSNTDTGGRVVELSQDEFRELYLLAKSCNPEIKDVREALWELQNHKDFYDFEDFDFTFPLENVRAFSLAQFNINKIRGLVDAIEKSIKK